MAYVSVKATADANSYQKTMKSMAQETKALASQWTATQAKAKAFGSETDVLKSKAGALSDKIKLQKEIVKLAGEQYGKLSISLTEQKTKHDELKNKVEAAKKAYEDSAKATGENSEQSKKLKEELTKLETELKTNENSINKTEGALNKQATACNNAEAKLYSMEGELKNVNKELQNQKLDAFAGGCDKAGKKLEVFGQKMTIVSAGIAAFGVSAAKMAVDFEDSMAKVSTIMDTGEMSVGEMEKAIVNLSNETGIAATDIAANVYNAISAGQKTGDAVNFVEQSTRLATAGFAESGDTLDLLTTILNAYGLEAGQVNNVSDMLIQTQNLGKTTVAELSSAMGKVIPTANANSVALDQLCAGYAIMTANGVATAESTTYMNAMLNELGKTGSITDGILREKTGKSFKELMADGASLADVLAIVDGAAKEQNLSMSDMFSSSEAAKAGLIMLGDGADTFNSTLGQMRESTGATDAAFDKMKTKSYDIKLTLNELKNTVMEFGQTIMTSATPTIGQFSDKVKALCDWFGTLNEGQRQNIIKIGLFAAAIAPACIVLGKMGQGVKGAVEGFRAMRDVVTKVTAKITAKTVATTADATAETVSTVALAANATATSAGTVATLAHTLATKASALATKALGLAMKALPILLIAGMIAGLVARMVDLYKKNEKFREIVNQVWDTVKVAFGKVNETLKRVGEVAGQVFGKIGEVVGSAMNAAKETAIEKLNNIKSAYEENGGGIKGVVAGAWEGIKGYYTAGFSFVNNLTGGKLTEIKNKFTNKLTEIKTEVSGKLNGVKEAFSNAFSKCKEVVSTVFETIKNIITVAFMEIKEIISIAANIITLPFQFIWENCKGIVIEAWNAIKEKVQMEIGAISNIISTVMTAIWMVITTVWTNIQTGITTVLIAIQTIISTAWNTISAVVTSVINAISSTVSSVFNDTKNTVAMIWNAIKSAIDVPINAAKTAISTAVNTISSTVSSVFDGVKKTVTTIWNEIKSAIETPINAAKTAVENAIDAIKKAFNFEWSLPKLKVPKVEITGKFSLDPPSVPKFDIEWYKTGGIMTSPTMFGMNGNRAMVGGEAGAEAILPLEQFYTRLNRMLNNKLQTIQNMTNVYVESHTYIDSDEVASRTETKVSDKMVDRYKKRR